MRAVFADEAYNIDYHHELIGIPQRQTTFFHRPRKDEKATLLYTLSDLGVLGAVHPGTGKVVWRQLLEGADADVFLRGVQDEGSVVSAAGRMVQSWDAMSGKEKWGNEFPMGIVKDLEVMETAAGSEGEKNILALFEVEGKGLLRKLSGNTGDVVWEFEDKTEDLPLQVSTNAEHVFVVSLHGSTGAYNIKVTILDPVTGKKTNEYILNTKTDVYSPADVLLVGANSAAPIVAWTDKEMKSLKVNILGKLGSVQSLPLKDLEGAVTKVTIHAPGLVQSLPHFLVHSHSPVANRADVYHIDLKSSRISKEYELPKLGGRGIVSVSSQDANVYFTRITEDEVIIVSSVSHGILGRWQLTSGTDEFVHGASEVVQRSNDVYAVRSAVVTEKDNWVLVRNGAVDWTRVEGLSGAVAAEWAEIPESETLKENLEVEAHSNPLSAYVHRVKRHASDLRYLPDYLQALPRRLLSSIFPVEAAKSATLVRDSFGFSKLVIVATQRGKVYGLNAGNSGAVVWSTDAFRIPVGKKWDVKGLWVEPSRGLATIRGSEGEYVIFKVTTGAIVESLYPGQWPPVKSTAVVDSASGRWMLTVGDDGNPGEVPKEWAPKEILVVQGNDGSVKGLRFEAEGINAEPVIAWSFTPAFGQKVIKVTARPVHDPVASIGRVLADRTVMYKYLNPNIVLVTAVSDQASTASFYLLDSVSGDVLHSSSHEGVDTTQPITSALTENWFVYSLWSDIAAPTSTAALPASKGYQIVISELYESSVANDRGPLGYTNSSSSLEPSDIPNAEPAVPHVLTQSFLIPEAISHMSVTQTRQGITTRQLLCTLDASNAIIGIPRAVLDPRRPVGRDPTPAEAEEGLFRYQPGIEFDPKIIISHKREVAGIRGVITSPAILESTSLVLAYGLDIFGTRVAPSMAFDVLGKSFNKLSLVGTVLALWIGVLVVAPMVSYNPMSE